MRMMKAALLASVLALAPAVPALAQTNIINVGISSPSNGSMDPHRASSSGDKGLVGWMFNGLLRFPPGSADPAALEPDLAESYEISADGLTLTFHLREGVKFHGDWGVMAADDVVYSLERAKDADRSSFAGSYKSVERIEAVDPKTVKVTLSAPVPGVLGLFANYHGGNIVSKAAAESMGEEFAQRPVGTGPFLFEEHVTQQHIKLGAHKDYFRGAPKADGIMLRFVPSDASRELAISSGELHMVSGVRQQRWVDRWSKEEGVSVDQFWPAEFITLHINKSIPPLDDIRVRQAVAQAVNIDQLVQFVGGDIAPRGCSIVPTGYLGSDCSWNVAFDPEGAKKLLAEAGFPNGIEIPSVVSSVALQQPVMEVVQAQLAEAGITLKMEVVDHPTYHERIRQNLSGLTFYGAARFPVADSYLTEFYHSDAIVGKPTAITNFSHCDVADAQIEAARVELDADKQLALWKEAQELIHADLCAIPLYNLRQIWLRSDKLDYGYDLDGSMNLAPALTEASSVSQ